MDRTNSFCFHLAIEPGFSGPVNVLFSNEHRENASALCTSAICNCFGHVQRGRVPALTTASPCCCAYRTYRTCAPCLRIVQKRLIGYERSPFVIDRSSSHDSHPCLARRAFGLLKPRLTALRVYPAALVSKCQSWFRSNQKQTRCLYVRSPRTAALSVNRWLSLQSLPAVPIRALTISSKTSQPNRRPVSVCCADQRHKLCWSLD